MGIHEVAQVLKLEKPSSPPLEQEQEQQQKNAHVYPDWAAFQAFYGPRMCVSPYFNPAAVSGHPPPPYMWGPPQHMMPPPPYAATVFYPHGGVYAHHQYPTGPNLPTTPLNIDLPTVKSLRDSDRSLIKKLKGFDGLAMSIGGNVIANAVEVGSHNSRHISGGETEGSSEGSDGNTTEGGGEIAGKRSRERSPTGVIVPSANSIAELNLKKKIPSATAKLTTTTTSPPIVSLIPNESLLQNEREVKRERRKQSNRDSARKSRLRKQAEAEELSVNVGALNSENLSLRFEINILSNNSDKLKLQNAKLMEKLNNTQKVQVIEKDFKLGGSSFSTTNLISRVENSSDCLEGESNKNHHLHHHPDSGGKLRQLLASSSRADVVAAR